MAAPQLPLPEQPRTNPAYYGLLAGLATLAVAGVMSMLTALALKTDIATVMTLMQ